MHNKIGLHSVFNFYSKYFYESPEHVARLHLKRAFTSSIECNQVWTKGNNAARKVFAEI